MRINHSSSHRARRVRFEQLEPRHMLAYLAGDFNLSGAVDNSDYNVWRSSYGEVGETAADGNGDMIVDSADYVVWRKNQGKTLADLPPDAPAEISAAATSSIQVTWAASSGATSYNIQRIQPDTESNFSTITTAVTSLSFTDNTTTSGTSYEYRVVAQNSHGSSQPSKPAGATSGQANLTAFRPQFRQDPNAPTAGPIYAPWPKKAVREIDETSSTLGPGIRMNMDDDNQNGTRDRNESGNAILAEDDLSELKVDRLPGQGNLVLATGFRLALYADPKKQTPLPFDVNGFNPVTFTNNSATVWVEWIDTSQGVDNVSLIDPATSTTLDSVRFHSFHSVLIVFGGNGQNPADIDKDGSIGDFVKGGPNREGIFDVAQSLYDTGWNVYPFDEEDVDAFADVPYTLITQTIDWGQVDFFGMIGYSQGGGAVHDLIERTFSDGYVPSVGVWVDAIDHDGVLEENDWPNEVLYLLNIYEDNDLLLDGGPITNPQDMFPGTTLDEHDVTGQTPTLKHTSIDDDPGVQNLIRTRLNQWIPR